MMLRSLVPAMFIRMVSMGVKAPGGQGAFCTFPVHVFVVKYVLVAKAGSLYAEDEIASFHSITPTPFTNFSHSKSQNTHEWNLLNQAQRTWFIVHTAFPLEFPKETTGIRCSRLGNI